MLTMPCTLVSGLMTPSTAMAKNNGITEPLDTRDSSLRARRMAKAGSTGRTEVTMRGNSSMASSRASESTILLTLTRPIKVSSGCQTWRAVELRPGRMADATKVISRTARKTVRAPSNGPTGTNTLGVGETGSNMASEFGFPRKRAP